MGWRCRCTYTWILNCTGTPTDRHTNLHTHQHTKVGWEFGIPPFQPNPRNFEIELTRNNYLNLQFPFFCDYFSITKIPKINQNCIFFAIFGQKFFFGQKFSFFWPKIFFGQKFSFGQKREREREGERERERGGGVGVSTP